MADSRFIASLAGPTIVVMTLAEAINFRIWTSNTAPLIFLNGTLLFFAGLTIVRTHNLWVRDWPVLVTLTGWLGIVLGLFRMLFPRLAHLQHHCGSIRPRRGTDHQGLRQRHLSEPRNPVFVSTVDLLPSPGDVTSGKPRPKYDGNWHDGRLSIVLLFQ